MAVAKKPASLLSWAGCEQDQQIQIPVVHAEQHETVETRHSNPDGSWTASPPQNALSTGMLSANSYTDTGNPAGTTQERLGRPRSYPPKLCSPIQYRLIVKLDINLNMYNNQSQPFQKSWIALAFKGWLKGAD
ncbi:hypothetical protein SELMODRAFT_410388 [Selaginella moellendorffii]|uniref:Uncharacterized protein n=1 Tax=Selaginella moellendorffii TaxID=88036 RepID=D8REL0_SELML|nr:hypothetical protein SELMODRAFT_410388 [Selaginella moellendorffii]